MNDNQEFMKFIQRSSGNEKIKRRIIVKAARKKKYSFRYAIEKYKGIKQCAVCKRISNKISRIGLCRNCSNTIFRLQPIKDLIGAI